MYLSLQTGRAIAATLVILYHLGEIISLEKYFGLSAFVFPFAFGDSGVEFFFVLSGFIIYHAYKDGLGKPNTLYPYLYKRLVRIYPTYLIIFLIVLCIAYLVPQPQDYNPYDISLVIIPPDIVTFIKSLLLFPQERGVVSGTGASVLIVAWSLQYEIMFYLLFGFGIISKRAGIGLIGLFISGSLFGLSGYSFPFSFLFNEFVWLFLMGMLTAELARLKIVQFVHLRSILFVGLLICSLVAIDSILNGGVNSDKTLNKYEAILYGIGYSLIVLAMVKYESRGKVFLNNKFIQLLGEASYSMYLIHLPVIIVLCKMSTDIGLDKLGYLGALIAYSLIFTFCIAISIIFYLTVEKPTIKWFRQIHISKNILKLQMHKTSTN